MLLLTLSRVSQEITAILRNDKGQIVGGISKVILVVSANCAEVEALRLGMNCAFVEGFRNVIIEYDCDGLIDRLGNRRQSS
ncbi:hypothetical protein V6N13_114594 [Hibiscus sabdariffa]